MEERLPKHRHVPRPASQLEARDVSIFALKEGGWLSVPQLAQLFQLSAAQIYRIHERLYLEYDMGARQEPRSNLQSSPPAKTRDPEPGSREYEQLRGEVWDLCRGESFNYFEFADSREVSRKLVAQLIQRCPVSYQNS